MTLPLMPKATAVWLVNNTTLTFKQIASFCGMHELEVQGIADGQVAGSILEQNPIKAKQLSQEEIERCQQDPEAEIELLGTTKKFIDSNKNKKKKRYTPVGRRQDKPNAIAWLLKNCPDIKDNQVIRLIGTTKKTIQSIKEKTHWNWGNITPRDPVLLGLCTQSDLDELLRVMNHKKDKEEQAAAAAEETTSEAS